MVYVCHNMGWDYHTYISQPEWFIEEVVLYFRTMLDERVRASKKR